ncbi:hypothetical protein B0A48_09969 [Cryoendolithus antarcticus]|uniref:Uncharacterized protein n=1 Tax=Cryoendolithus antarcticus TaxID=1507870 RepID=A0A1V8T381_9PEZI|nr:hypothetical protein B0A48_09969 [Cryoendolithus antarcticus]
MSRQMFEDCSVLCQHPDFTMGCPACRYMFERGEYDEAVAEQRRCAAEIVELEGKVAAEEDLLRLKPGLRKNDTSKLDENRVKLELAQQGCPVLVSTVAVLRESLAGQEEMLQSICQQEGNPDAIMQRFGRMTEEGERELMSFDEANWVDFEDEDKHSKLKKEEVDMTKILATSDTLVQQGHGLLSLLHAGHALPERRIPTQGIGETVGPAYMSVGRSYKMFGGPEEIVDARTAARERAKEALEEAKRIIAEAEDEAAASDPEPLLTAVMKGASISPSPVDQSTSQTPVEELVEEPQSERTYRDAQLPAPTQSIAPDVNVWEEILSPDELGLHLPRVCEQYVLLVRAKRNERTLYGCEGWDDVEETRPTFEGLTNWVMRCRKADVDFKATLLRWQKSVTERNGQVGKALREYGAINRYSDESLNMGDATQFHNGLVSLMRLDSKAIGRS